MEHVTADSDAALVHKADVVRVVDFARGAALIGDTGYNSNAFIDEVKARDLRPVIHAKPERKKKHRLDRNLYRKRYIVEVFFFNLKRFRAIATR